MKDLNIIGPYLGDPFLYSDWQNATVEFVGKLATHHEIVQKLYFQPFSIFLEEFCKISSDKRLIFNIKLTYFNTSGSKHLLSFFKLLENYKEKKSLNLVVNWFYFDDDDDMIDVVEEYEDLAEIDFKHNTISDRVYWSQLNYFGDFISETDNFIFLNEIENIENNLENSLNKQLAFERIESILNEFDKKLDFIYLFKNLIYKRLHFVLAQRKNISQNVFQWIENRL